jgi:hypothetical protein
MEGFKKTQMPEGQKNLRSMKLWKVEWFGNNSIDKSGAQEHVLSIANCVDAAPVELFPVLSHTEKYGRWWGATTKENFGKIIAKDHGFYEILPLLGKRKVYFDFDAKQGKSLDDIEALVAGSFPGARQQISGYEAADGMSVHVTLSNYTAESLDGLWKVKEWAKHHSAEFGVDGLVYTKNRNMKCINQSKAKKVPKGHQSPPVQAYIKGSKVLSKHLIMHDFDDDAVDVNTLQFDIPVVQDAEIAKPAERAEKLDILSIRQHELPVPVNFDLKNANAIEKLAMLPCPHRDHPDAFSHNVMWRVMVWCLNNGLQFDEFYAWAKKRDDSVPYLQAMHSSWDRSQGFHVKYKTIDLLLERFYPEIHTCTAAKIMRAQFIDAMKNATVLDKYFLSADDIPVDAKFIALASQMWSNKTGTVVEYLCRVARGKSGQSQGSGQSPSVLWITPRITLSENTLARLKKDGIDVVNYRTGYTKRDRMRGKPEEDSDKVIWSIQSLHYLRKNYDYVVVDEIETVLNSFSKDCVTHKKLGASWEVWKTVIRNAKQVIFMDALYSKLTDNMIDGFIKEHDSEPAVKCLTSLGGFGFTKTKESWKKVVITTKKREGDSQLLEYSHFSAWFDNIMKRIERGEKVYVFVPYKGGKTGVIKIAEAIRKHMGWTDGEQILSYFADKEEEKKRLLDIEAVWADAMLRCVVTNGTISVGVNFDVPDVFDSIHVFHSADLPLRDNFQGYRRVRRPKNNIIHIFRSRQCFFGHYVDKENLNFPKCEIFNQLRKDLMIELNANKSCSENWDAYELFMEMTGLQMLPKNTDEVSKETAKYIRELINNADCVFDWDKIADLPDLTEEQVEQWELTIWSSKVTLEKRLMYLKHMFKKKVPTPSALPTGMELRSFEMLRGQLWAKNVTLPDQIRELKWYESDHMINRLFAENGIDIKTINFSRGHSLKALFAGAFAFPDNMKTAIPLDEIQKKFVFHNQPKNSRTALVASMINSFFGKRVYNLKGQKRVDGERIWHYETDVEFGISLSTACMFTAGKYKKPEKVTELMPDEEEYEQEDEDTLI